MPSRKRLEQALELGGERALVGSPRSSLGSGLVATEGIRYETDDVPSEWFGSQ
jgi:hypothetical protein